MILLLPCLMLSGCAGVYETYGFGRVAPAQGDSREGDLAVALPGNAPSISQRYRPETKREILPTTESVHEGIDIFAPTGTPVIAAAAGEVVAVHRSFLYGRRIFIDHGADASGRRIMTRYFHLEEQMVREGDRIGRGQRIGSLGKTGLLAGFPHLHFEVREIVGSDGDTEPLNPHLYWMDGPGRVTCLDVTQKLPNHPLGMTYPVPCRGVYWR